MSAINLFLSNLYPGITVISLKPKKTDVDCYNTEYPRPVFRWNQYIAIQYGNNLCQYTRFKILEAVNLDI